MLELLRSVRCLLTHPRAFSPRHSAMTAAGLPTQVTDERAVAFDLDAAVVVCAKALSPLRWQDLASPVRRALMLRATQPLWCFSMLGHKAALRILDAEIEEQEIMAELEAEAA